VRYCLDVFDTPAIKMASLVQLIVPQPCFDEFFVNFNFLHGIAETGSGGGLKGITDVGFFYIFRFLDFRRQTTAEVIIVCTVDRLFNDRLYIYTDRLYTDIVGLSDQPG